METLYNNYSMHIQRWLKEGPNKEESNQSGFWNDLIWAVLRHYHWLGSYTDAEILKHTMAYVTKFNILSLPQTCTVTEDDIERIIKGGIKYCHEHNLVRRNTTAKTFPITINHVQEIIGLMEVKEWNTFYLRWFCFIFRLYRFIATHGERLRNEGWYYVSSRDMWTFGFHGSKKEAIKRYVKFRKRAKDHHIIYFVGRRQVHLRVKLRIQPEKTDGVDITTPAEGLVRYYGKDKVGGIFKKVKKEYLDCLKQGGVV